MTFTVVSSVLERSSFPLAERRPLYPQRNIVGRHFLSPHNGSSCVTDSRLSRKWHVRPRRPRQGVSTAAAAAAAAGFALSPVHTIRMDRRRVTNRHDRGEIGGFVEMTRFLFLNKDSKNFSKVFLS